MAVRQVGGKVSRTRVVGRYRGLEESHSVGVGTGAPVLALI